MEPDVIPGFRALEFKERAQARVQAELEGLSDDDLVRRIQEIVKCGPSADWYKQMQEAQAAQRT